MAYPDLNYIEPDQELGLSTGSNFETPQIKPMAMTANPYANQQGWQSDLTNSLTHNTYRSLGLDGAGMYQPTGATQGNWFNRATDWASGNTELLKLGAGLITGGFGAWNGMKQNNLLERSMKQQSNQFREQMDISKQNMNRNLVDRQRARVASNPNAYESVDSYMKKYGVK